MIVISLIFLALFFYEWRFLKTLQRKKRTSRIVISVLLVAYLYVMAVYSIKNLPSLTKPLEYTYCLIFKNNCPTPRR